MQLVADSLGQAEREEWNSLCHNSLSWLNHREVRTVNDAGEALAANDANDANDAGEAQGVNDTIETQGANDTVETHEANGTVETHGANDAGEACIANDTVETYGANNAGDICEGIASSTSTLPEPCNSIAPFTKSPTYYAPIGMSEAKALLTGLVPRPSEKVEIYPWNPYDAIEFLSAALGGESTPIFAFESYNYYDVLLAGPLLDQLALQLPVMEMWIAEVAKRDEATRIIVGLPKFLGKSDAFLFVRAPYDVSVLYLQSHVQKSISPS
jgi:hypothetical protein